MSGVYIKIPKEFEQHFRNDRFEDSLNRLRTDAHLLAGKYEKETADMLIEAFKNAIEVPEHGRLIDADGDIGLNVTMNQGGKCRVDLIALTIIPADE